MNANNDPWRGLARKILRLADDAEDDVIFAAGEELQKRLDAARGTDAGMSGAAADAAAVSNSPFRRMLEKLAGVPAYAKEDELQPALEQLLTNLHAGGWWTVETAEDAEVMKRLGIGRGAWRAANLSAEPFRGGSLRMLNAEGPGSSLAASIGRLALALDEAGLREPAQRAAAIRRLAGGGASVELSSNSGEIVRRQLGIPQDEWERRLVLNGAQPSALSAEEERVRRQLGLSEEEWNRHSLTP